MNRSRAKMNQSQAVRGTLDEVIQQIRDLLKDRGGGSHQIVDLGVHGWFHLYSVVDVVAAGALRDNVFTKTIPIKDYVHNVGTIGSSLLVDEVVSFRGTYDMATEATKALTKLGMKRQRVEVVIRDLRGERNPITGGGVGGYAYFKKHGISIDRGVVLQNPSFAIEALCHEWGHMQWLQFSKHQKEFIRSWYRENVVKKTATQAKISDQDKDWVVGEYAARFRILFQKSFGVTFDGLATLFVNVKVTVPGRKVDAWDLLALSNLEVQGWMKRKTETKGKELDPKTGGMVGYRSFRKDERVVVYSGHIFDPSGIGRLMDIPMTIQTRPGVPENDFKMLGTTLEQVKEVVVPDLDLTFRSKINKDSELTAHTFEFFLDALERYDSLGEFFKDRLGQLEGIFTKVAGDLYGRMADKVPHEYSESKLAAEVVIAFQGWKGIDLNKTLFQGIKAGVLWGDRGAALAVDFGVPMYSWFRKQAYHFNLTPSKYAASNDKELWADTVSYSAIKIREVPDSLLRMMRSVIQGRTNESIRMIQQLQAVWAV